MSTEPSLQRLIEARRSFGIPCPPETSNVHSLPQNRINKSILELIGTACPAAQRRQLFYVVADLKRSSTRESWGISFSQFDGHLVLGEVRATFKQSITWSTVIAGYEHTPDHRQIYKSPNEQPSRAYYREFVKYYARSMQTAGYTLHNQILPGDMIIAIDGFQPNAFHSLHEITNYLRSSLHVSLILLRHPQATSAALTLYPAPSLHTAPCTASYHVWRRVLLDSLAPIIRQVPMPREVTPDFSSAASKNSSRIPQFDNIAFLKLQMQQTLWNQQMFASSGIGSGHSIASPNIPMTSSPSRPIHIKKKCSVVAAKPVPLPVTWRNPWFQKDGQSIPYDDNWEFSPEDGNRAELFLPQINDFHSWLQERKRKWRRNYKVYEHLNENEDNGQTIDERDLCSVAKDFWTHQGFSSFEAWLQQRREIWRTSYKVYRNKRQRIHQECEEVVHLNNPSTEGFHHWLRIRKNQWKIFRRKRQRQREEVGMISFAAAKLTESEVMKSTADSLTPAAVVTPEKQEQSLHLTPQRKRRKFLPTSATDLEMACIDDILEEEERQKKARAERPPIDISFLFDANKMAPDDVVVHVFKFLDRREHGKLLCVNKETSESLKARDDVWRQLCPSTWVLPRRPRKPWHEIYISKHRSEQYNYQKRWDDLLLKCYAVLLKGDHLQKIEKLVAKGEADFGFNANYVSPVVCERNCLLNLAVIHERHKIVRWLVDKKGAAIESYDRGHFTPLLNAAWAGHNQIVRFLLQRGANRSKVGFYHYSKPLSSPEFAGLTAEGWARRKGHGRIAELIRLGL